MREIKFRGWDKKLKIMHSEIEMGKDELTINPDGRGFVNVNSKSTKLSQYYNHIIPLQYIGLKDKNKKMIFEKDIFKGYGILIIKYGYVTHENGYSIMGFGVWDNKMQEWREDYHREWCEEEIIGNCFENPELLNND